MPGLREEAEDVIARIERLGARVGDDPLLGPSVASALRAMRHVLSDIEWEELKERRPADGLDADA